MLLIKNCNIILLDSITKGSVLINNKKIEKINPSCDLNCETIDGTGLYLSPGFIDVHIHGAGGYDTMDGTYEALDQISKTIVKNGTTSFLPTTMTVSIDAIKKSVEAISYAKSNGTHGANVLGAHLEGPFINPNAIGAQNPKYIKLPSIDTFKEMVDNYENDIVSITLAPEVPGALDLIDYLSSKNIVCSIGHTKATYEETKTAIKHGLKHSTHLFNAMTPLHHREPGVIGAIYDSNITTETISDGIHISYPSLRISYKVKTTDKVLLVSDAMMACGMPDGLYSLGGQDVEVKNGAARLLTGSLAGSVLTLDKAIKNVYNNSDIPLNEIVKMATYNGAKHCNVADRKGLIKEGYDADLVLFDGDINVKYVFVNGELIHKA